MVLSLIHALHNSLQHTVSLLSLLHLQQSPGNGFNDVDHSTSVFTASHPCRPSPISLKLLSWTNWVQLPNSRLTKSLKNSLHSTSSSSTPLRWLNWTQSSGNTASEQTQQKSPFLCWCGWSGVTCSTAVALSAWCRTAWQHRLPQLSYCCVTSLQMWRVSLLRVHSLPCGYIVYCAITY
jgi:hypothetical protein